MKTWFSIRAQTATEPAEVSIYGDIGSWGVNAASFIDAVKGVQGPIRVRINSGGGDVFDGLAIYNYLAGRGNVETVIDGLAASAASLPFLAGSKRTMPKAAFLMVHNPWSGAVGGADDMRKAADVLDRIGAGLANVYARVTGMAVEAVKALMDAETWLDGDAALAGKWATEVVDLGPVNASVRLGRYAKTPASILAAAAPGSLIVEDYVSLTYQDAEAKGEVAGIVTTGTASGADGSVEASESDPAAIVALLSEVPGTGEYQETEIQVARLFSTLTRIEPPPMAEEDDASEGDAGVMDASAKISAPKPGANNQTKPMSKLMALLGIQPAEDQFLMAAIKDLGVTAEGLADARKANDTSFLETHIKARISTADARVADVIAAAGIDANAPDIAAAVKAKVDDTAAKKAAEILAAKGIRHDVGNAAAATGAATDKTGDEIRAEFSKMKPGQERTAFFNKHKSVLIS